MRPCLRSIFALSLAVGALAPVLAGDGPSATEIGIPVGAGQIDGDLHGKDSQIDPVVGVGLNHWLCDNLAWSADLTSSWCDPLYGSDDPSVLTFRTGPELYFSKPDKKLRWFFTLAFGLTSYDFGDGVDENRRVDLTTLH